MFSIDVPRCLNVKYFDHSPDMIGTKFLSDAIDFILVRSRTISHFHMIQAHCQWGFKPDSHSLVPDGGPV